MTKSTLGRLFFAIAIAAFGIQQLVTAEFVRLVPPLPPWIPGHPLWARLVGVILLAAGAAIGIGRGRIARWAAAVVSVLIALSILFLHLPKAAANPLVGFVWTNPCKALAMLGGTFLVAATLPDDGSGLARTFRWLAPLGRLFLAGFMILGGIQHFVYADFVSKLVPAWIPVPQFWVYFTGIALVAGGVGMLVPKTARLAALMAGIMIFLWVLLLHIPRALADVHVPAEMSGVFEALAMSGIAFILADRRADGLSVSANG
jgi:uncharacterized membrane protein